MRFSFHIPEISIFEVVIFNPKGPLKSMFMSFDLTPLWVLLLADYNVVTNWNGQGDKINEKYDYIIQL